MRSGWETVQATTARRTRDACRSRRLRRLGRGAQRGDLDRAPVAPPHPHGDLVDVPLVGGGCPAEVRRRDDRDRSLPREGALDVAFALLRRPDDLADLLVREEHRLLVLAREAQQPQTLREALDRRDHRDAENREGDEHLEQREPTLAARGGSWRARVSAPGSGPPSSTTTALKSAASGPTRCGARALTTRVSEGGRRARRGRAFPPTRLAPRSGRHARAARQDPPHPAHSRTLRTRPVAASTVTR